MQTKKQKCRQRKKNMRMRQKNYGALIYPMTTVELNKGLVMPILDQNIIIKTINLNDDWRNIEDDMLKFALKFEKARR